MIRLNVSFAFENGFSADTTKLNVVEPLGANVCGIVLFAATKHPLGGLANDLALVITQKQHHSC